ncbi:hypothetical protein O3P69_008903 [Scylla paramamosain]|uniref:Ionotropic glutamate receptor C-terminal domain-containing protein n=1 Tax=Scylla paramamosain TaxID=85552 RepID=A0AAW0TP45_SCYPA
MKVFVVFLWVHVIIVTVAYSANLTAFLTVERIPEGITSLKQLYDSKLFVYAIGGPFFADNMAESGNEYVRQMPLSSGVMGLVEMYLLLLSCQAFPSTFLL